MSFKSNSILKEKIKEEMKTFFVWVLSVLKKGLWVVGFIPFALDFASAYIPGQYTPQFVKDYLNNGITLESAITLFVIMFFVSVYLVHLDNQSKYRDARLEWKSERQHLQQRIDEFEDQQANIRFKKTQDFSFIEKSPTTKPFSDLENVNLKHFLNLDENGIPGWINIAAYLRGENRSTERGFLEWKIIDHSLPPILTVDPDHKGTFSYPNGMPFDAVDGQCDALDARYDLPLKIVDRSNVNSIIQAFSSPLKYQVVIEYVTQRGIDNYSKPYQLTLEGDLSELLDDLHERWGLGGFHHLIERTQSAR